MLRSRVCLEDFMELSFRAMQRTQDTPGAPAWLRARIGGAIRAFGARSGERLDGAIPAFGARSGAFPQPHRDGFIPARCDE
jgi:hypothetical protein